MTETEAVPVTVTGLDGPPHRPAEQCGHRIQGGHQLQAV